MKMLSEPSFYLLMLGPYSGFLCDRKRKIDGLGSQRNMVSIHSNLRTESWPQPKFPMLAPQVIILGNEFGNCRFLRKLKSSGGEYYMNSSQQKMFLIGGTLLNQQGFVTLVELTKKLLITHLRSARLSECFGKR